ncbi:allene oxide cyclase barrel-like domain-containing protein [Streptomyces roseoviridis]|uniref:allene oxide cyclase barrel-like domain-containing protein n=1 Tax=Streptomyces roseoviridis TaxID=67361 RepID=UPI0031E80812
MVTEGNPRRKAPARRTALTRIAAVSLATASLGVLAATGVEAVGAEAGSPARAKVEIVEAHLRTDQWHVIDAAPNGVSLGDQDVYSGTAFKDGREIGSGGGSCQVIHVDGDDVTTQCVLTMELERGSVTLQALWTKGPEPVDMAVTGGTGAYRNARGSARFWDISLPTERMRAEILL